MIWFKAKVTLQLIRLAKYLTDSGYVYDYLCEAEKLQEKEGYYDF